MYIESELIEAIHKTSRFLTRKVTFMEVCGTHTMSIFKHGIKSMLPENIRLISGPGCPVCVTPPQYIDQAVEMSKIKDVVICTFGDMIRVPGTNGTLETARADGADVRIAYSPMDCLKAARENPEKTIVFLAVGFETTAPIVGLAVKKAESEGIDNFCILSGLKRLFPALEVLLQSGEINIDGLICPGHVSAVTGQEPYRFIPEKHKIPCVITGFEAADILMSVYMLSLQVLENRAEVENAYKRAGTQMGNALAIKTMDEIFKAEDDSWRGFGVIPGSGLELSSCCSRKSARIIFDMDRPVWTGDGSCQCGNIIKGLKVPTDCPLFKKVCTPENPVGACMVSGEGTCAAYYKYGLGMTEE